jgi:integrase
MIPETAECIGGVGPTGAGNKKQINLNNRGEPCAKCRNKTHRENNRWEAKTPAAVRSIQIDSDQQPLSSLLDWWKQGFDCVPLSHNGVNYHLRQLADEAGLERPVRAHDLRYTHAVMLSQRGWTAPQIMERLGYSSLEPVRQFIDDSE